MTKHSSRKNFWFHEPQIPSSAPGMRSEFFVKEILYQGKSPFQKICAFEVENLGRTLVIDDIVQTTEFDEYIYHEMLVLLSCLLVGTPKKVLIIGGGDGGSLREALRYKTVEKAVMVEIDELVVKVSEKYLPKLSRGAFKNKKAEVLFSDGLAYVKEHKNEFDLVILDLSDPFPDSPAEQLFDIPFFNDIKLALKKDGVIALRGESISFLNKENKKLMDKLKQVFPYVTLRGADVPSYTLALFGFITASTKNLEKIAESELKKRYKNVEGEIKYLSPEMFFASKVLPPFLS